MKYGIIIGSHRNQSQSAKVAGYAQKSLTAMNSSSQFYTVDLSKKTAATMGRGHLERGRSLEISLGADSGRVENL